MNFRPKSRRQSFKPPKFAQAKPRFKRVSKKRKETRNISLPKAAGQSSSRHPNRLPECTDPKSYITKGGRHRLYGEDYERLRWNAYQRAGGKCECDRCAEKQWPRWPQAALWDKAAHISLRGVFAHNEHGPRKSDELHRGKWMNHFCHMRTHNCNGKPVPKKERVS